METHHGGGPTHGFVPLPRWARGPLSGSYLLLCLDKSLVVILNYALTAEQPDPVVQSPTLPANGPDPLPAWGRSGGATCPGGGSPQPKQLGAPDLPGNTGPPPGPGSPYTIRHPAWVGPEPPRDTRAEPRGFHWKTRLPTAFNAVGGSAHCHSKARGGFGQVALLVACYQGTQSSRWRRLLRVCQPTMPVGYDGSASPIKAPAR